VEHALKLDCKLEPAFSLKLRKHVSFRIVRDRLVVKEAYCEMRPIISLEDVLLCDELKEADGFIEDNLDFSIRSLNIVMRRRWDNKQCNAPHSILFSKSRRYIEMGTQRLTGAGLPEGLEKISPSSTLGNEEGVKAGAPRMWGSDATMSLGWMADRRAECDESIVHDVGGTSRGSRPEVGLFREWLWL